MRLFLLSALVAFAHLPAAVAQTPGPPPGFTLEGNVLQLPGAITYATGAPELLPESDATLQHAKAYLDAKAYISVMRIEVHLSGDAAPATAQSLSEARAMSVARWLVGKGVDCKRLLPVGFGATKPVAGNDTPEGRARNARTELHNAALRDRPIGGMPLDGGGRIAGDPCK